jgi:hypothetical protein
MVKYVTPVLVNRHKCSTFDVYIGRGSKWGNDHPIDNSKGHTRQIVVEMYRHDLYAKLESGELTIQDFLDLSGKIIGCSCAPLVCHGDVIIEIFNEIVEMLNES